MSECGHEEKPLGVIDCYNPVCHQWPNFNDRLLGKFHITVHSSFKSNSNEIDTVKFLCSAIEM